MCGIAGYVGSQPAAPLIVECLERLQYRGYDSAGVAIRTNNQISIFRTAGPVAGLRPQIPNDLNAVIGVGHTRWATHGLATLENAHPLTSCDGALAVVHNGIIENHAEIREKLEIKGHRFRTGTDSEVIPHLIEEEMKVGKSFEEAFLALHSQLFGTFAIVAIHRDYPCLLITRRGSPLVVGVGDGEYFPASDIPSFLPHTSRVLYLHEEECFRVDLQGLHRFATGNGEVKAIDVPLTLADLNPSQVGKGDQDHFMIKEILEQAGGLEEILVQDRTPIESVANSLRTCRKALFVGAGTSYHSSLFAEYLALHLGIENVRAVVASEFGQFAPHLTPEDVVVLFSQSGETADSIAAARLARARGSTLIAFTNSPLSTLAHEVETVVPLFCGPEIAVAATKSYTAQLAAVTLALCCSVRESSKGIAIVLEAANSLYNLTSDTSRQLIKQFARDLGDSRDVYLLGRGFQSITARESALKLKEVAGVRAEAFFLGEMKHGPLSLIDDHSCVIIFFGEEDYLAAKTAASELSSRGAKIYGIGPKPLPASAFHIRTDDIGLGLAMAQIAPVQLLSYEIARLQNLNPDRPRNLAKSVTVA
jgi:glutamine---fructose-6-phosphate transaminase (isomerizing)